MSVGIPLKSPGAIGMLADVVAVRLLGGAASGLEPSPVAPLPAALGLLLPRLRAALFPEYFGAAEDGPVTAGRLAKALATLAHDLTPLLAKALTLRAAPVSDEPYVESLAARFLAGLPDVRALLLTDVEAAMDGDPAAPHVAEVILAYPGVLALTYQRLAHRLYLDGVPLLPRLVTELGHAASGIDIHPGARIGSHCFIDHGSGVVIGETAVVGNRVRLYQGVTLGARSFPRDKGGRIIKGLARHPIIGDDVVIYAGATVLGRVTVGDGSIIGGGVWLTHDVPPRSRLLQPAAKEDVFSGAGDGI